MKILNNEFMCINEESRFESKTEIIFKIWHTNNQEIPLALKVQKPKYDDEISDAFDAHEMMQEVNSKFVAQQYFITLISKHLFTIMEPALRGTLTSLVQSTKYRNDDRKALLLFFKLILGVRAIHQANIIHTDLKADHVMFDKNQEPKIVGFLKLIPLNYVSRKQDTGSHMDPNMIDKDNVKYILPVDNYQLGVILYEMTQKGRVPFGEEDVIAKLQRGSYSFPEETNVALIFLIHSLTKKNLFQRWSSADAIRFINAIINNMPKKTFKKLTVSNKEDLPAEVLEFIPAEFRSLSVKSQSDLMKLSDIGEIKYDPSLQLILDSSVPEKTAEMMRREILHGKKTFGNYIGDFVLNILNIDADDSRMQNHGMFTII